MKVKNVRTKDSGLRVNENVLSKDLRCWVDEKMSSQRITYSDSMKMKNVRTKDSRLRLNENVPTKDYLFRLDESEKCPHKGLWTQSQ